MFLLAVLLLVFYFAYRLIPPQYYWIKRNVFHHNILQRLFAIFLENKAFVEQVRRSYEMHPDRRYVGSYQFLKPSLLVRDIELIKQITVKDFDHFTDHVDFILSESDPVFSKNLFTMKGKSWRELRNTISPAFTSSKMKAMFILISEASKKFTEHFEGLNLDVVEIEMKEAFSKYTNDVIATCAFGIKCDSLKEPHNEFLTMGKKITTSSPWRMIRMLMVFFFPKIFELLRIPSFSVEISKFFKKIITDTITDREEKDTFRPDLIQLLMEARKGKLSVENNPTSNDTGFATVEEIRDSKTNPTLEITDDVITAQALIFFLAGLETSSTLLSFVSYELAKNPEIQQKLIAEIDETLLSEGDVVSYENLSKMKYLDQVVSEGLRKWTPGYAISRQCTKDYTILPINKDEVSVTLTKGCCVMIPTIGIHFDPRFYGNPDVFDPERFNDENKKKISNWTYFPFGLGPRNCIGSRFALLEIKSILVSLLAKFEFEIINRTPVPLNLAKSFSITPKNGMWLGLRKRKCQTN